MNAAQKGGVLVGVGLLLVLIGVLCGYVLPWTAHRWAWDVVVIANTSSHYEEWVNGTFYEEYTHVYFFNLTNANEFLYENAQPKVMEVGPYVYRQRVRKVGVEYGQNDTVSYKLWTTQEFVADQSNGTENDQIQQLSEGWLREAYQAAGFSDLVLVSVKVTPRYLLGLFALLDRKAYMGLARQRLWELPNMVQRDMQQQGITCPQLLETLDIYVDTNTSAVLCDTTDRLSFLYNSAEDHSSNTGPALWFFGNQSVAQLQAHPARRGGRALSMEEAGRLVDFVQETFWRRIVAASVLRLGDTAEGYSIDQLSRMLKYAQMGSLALTSPANATHGPSLTSPDVGKFFGVDATRWPSTFSNVEYVSYYNKVFLPTQNITGYSRTFTLAETQAIYSVLTSKMDAFIPKAGGLFEPTVDGLMQSLWAGQLRQMFRPLDLSAGPYVSPALNENHNLLALAGYVKHLAVVSYMVVERERLGLVSPRSVADLVGGYTHSLLNRTVPGILPSHSNEQAAREDKRNWQQTHSTGASDVSDVGTWQRLHTFSSVPDLFYPNTSDSQRTVGGFSEDQVAPAQSLRFGGNDPERYIMEMFVPEFYRKMTMVYLDSSRKYQGLTLNRFGPPPDFLNTTRYDNLDYGGVFDGLQNTTLARNYPSYLSWPHYLHADLNFTTVDGLAPNSSQHQWYFDVEPITGTVFHCRRTYQVNQQAYLEMTANMYPQLRAYNACIVPFYWLSQTATLNQTLADDYESHLVGLRQAGQICLIALPSLGGVIFIVGVLLFSKEQWDRRHENDGAIEEDEEALLEETNQSDDMARLVVATKDIPKRGRVSAIKEEGSKGSVGSR